MVLYVMCQSPTCVWHLLQAEYKAMFDAAPDDGVHSFLAVFNPDTKSYGVLPRVEGRITMADSRVPQQL